jgi:hypothetical protein
MSVCGDAVFEFGDHRVRYDRDSREVVEYGTQAAEPASRAK